MAHSCPDCDVSLESIKYDTNANGDMLRMREGGGVLGTLGIRGATNISAYACPECRRVLFYADD